MSEIIYGRNPVLEALRAKIPLKKIFLAKGVQDRRLDEIKQSANRRAIAVVVVDRSRLAELAHSEKNQGVVAVLAPSAATSVEAIVQSQAGHEAPLIALLDGIEDPHNLGAILRSADAAGVHGVVLPKRRSASPGATVAKTSAGASAHVMTATVSNLTTTIEQLKKKNNMWFAGADQHATQLYTETDLTGAIGIVVGAEGQGLSRLVREKCDFLVRIPMFGKVNSLNASVAAALLFFEARRQRSKAEK